MSVPQRIPTIPSVWAQSAQTTIPNPPVKGVGYRNASLSGSAFVNGQLYGSIGDSAAWNQYINQFAGVGSQSERYGIAPYCPYTDYAQHSLALWTDGNLYQALLDPPVGTPCNNKSYWEQYTPSTVVPAPPITALAGVHLYVDYGKTTSGDGLSAATAFKNFSDCFAAMRTKFAGANGVFTSATWIPLFYISATGPGHFVTIEEGSWQFNNINMEINIGDRAFTMASGSIILHGCNVKFSGTTDSSFSLYHLNVNTSILTLSCGLVVYNSGVQAGVSNRGVLIRDSNLFVEASSANNFSGYSGMECVGTFMEIRGLINVRSTSADTMAQWAMCDILCTGNLSVDTTNNALDAGTTFRLINCCVHGNGTVYARGLELVGGTFNIVGGRFVSGTISTSRPQFGMLVRGLVFITGTAVSQSINPPITKGAITPGGTVDCGFPQANWPGAGAWVILGNGYYQA